MLPLSAPHRLVKGLYNEVDYRYQPRAYEKWTVWATQYSEGVEWKLETCEYCSPD